MKLLITVGGSGGKLWPVSNDEMPKQFSRILGQKSLFRHNLEILLEKYSPKDIYLSTKFLFNKFIKEQAPEISEDNIIFEPDYKKDSGPGTLYAILILSLLHPNEPFILIQSVCYREPRKLYLDMLDSMGIMVKKYKEPITGGIKPEYPDMGSDYLKTQKNSKVDMLNGIQFYKSDEFIWRTGDIEKTKKLIKKNDLFIHTNHLCWYPEMVLKEVSKYKPDWEKVLVQIKTKLLAAETDIKKVNIDKLFEKFTTGKLEDVSCHFFNNRGLIAVVPYKWTHIATWNSVYKLLDKDLNQNAIEGNIKAFDSKNNLLLQKVGEKKIVCIGIEDMIFVETKDSILICDLSSVADVKKYTENL